MFCVRSCFRPSASHRDRFISVPVKADERLQELSSPWSDLSQLEACKEGHQGQRLTLCCALQSLWVERTSLYLVQSLPGISRWFEVEKREVVRSAVPSQHHPHPSHSPHAEPAADGSCSSISWAPSQYCSHYPKTMIVNVDVALLHPTRKFFKAIMVLACKNKSLMEFRSDSQDSSTPTCCICHPHCLLCGSPESQGSLFSHVIIMSELGHGYSKTSSVALFEPLFSA